MGKAGCVRPLSSQPFFSDCYLLILNSHMIDIFVNSLPIAFFLNLEKANFQLSI